MEIGSKDKYYGHSSVLITDNNCGFVRLLKGNYMVKVRVYSDNNEIIRKKGIVLSCYSESKVIIFFYFQFFILK